MVIILSRCPEYLAACTALPDALVQVSSVEELEECFSQYLFNAFGEVSGLSVQPLITCFKSKSHDCAFGTQGGMNLEEKQDFYAHMAKNWSPSHATRYLWLGGLEVVVS